MREYVVKWIMVYFDEKSGYIFCKIEWGQWWQINEEVFIEINVFQGILVKDIKCVFVFKYIKIVVKGEIVIEVVSYLFVYRLYFSIVCIFCLIKNKIKLEILILI